MSRKAETKATNEEAPSTVVPRMRFPEFREAGEWRKSYFGELLNDIIDFRGRTPLKLAMEWGNGNIISLSANNVKNGFIDYHAECNLGSEELYGRWMGDVALEKDDIVFTMEAPLGNALLLPDSRKYILSQRVVAFKTSHEVLNRFLIQLIWSSEFQAAISELATGSTAKGINQKALKSVLIKIPLPSEQHKIAACLSSLDELIAAQAQKVKALKTHKKGLMQQLFPREGETQPRLRFPEFHNAGEWEATTLGEYFSPIRNGFVGTATPYYTSSGGVPYLQGKNIKGSKIDPGNLFFITPEFHVRQRKSHLKIGDILMVQSGHVGECAVVGADYEGCNCHALVILSPSRKLNSEFFVHYFYAPVGELAISQITTGNTIKHILASELKTLPVLVPNPAEQQRIASCLGSLDALITAESQKLEALKTHKKGLMQQLFPSPKDLRP